MIPDYGLEHMGVTVENPKASPAAFRAQVLEIYERKQTDAFKIAFAAVPVAVCLELMEAVG